MNINLRDQLKTALTTSVAVDLKWVGAIGARVIGIAIMLPGVLFCQTTPAPTPAKPPKVFAGGGIQEVYRIRLDKGDLLLESLEKIIKDYGIHDGAVLTGVGQVNNCTFHTAGSPKFTLVEPLQLAALDGLIADGETHFHAVVSSPAKGTYTGHLENGCVVENQVEITLLKFSGTPLIRKKGIIQPK